MPERQPIFVQVYLSLVYSLKITLNVRLYEIVTFYEYIHVRSIEEIMKNTDVLFEAISVSFIEIKESTLDQFVTEYFLTVFLEIERATLFNLTDLEIDLNSP